MFYTSISNCVLLLFCVCQFLSSEAFFALNGDNGTCWPNAKSEDSLDVVLHSLIQRMQSEDLPSDGSVIIGNNVFCFYRNNDVFV